jgi:hypothetical protein
MAEAYGNRGFVRYRLGDKPKAIADFQKAAQIFFSPGEYGRLPTSAQFHAIDSASTRQP